MGSDNGAEGNSVLLSKFSGKTFAHNVATRININATISYHHYIFICNEITNKDAR